MDKTDAKLSAKDTKVVAEHMVRSYETAEKQDWDEDSYGDGSGAV